MLSRALFLVLIICTTLQTVMMQQDPKHIACIKDYNDRFMDQRFIIKPMRVAICLMFCRSAGFKFAGVQYESYQSNPGANKMRCYCAARYSHLDKANNDNECRINCPDPGDKSLSCGANYRIAIYSIEQYDISRIGCYRDKANRDLPEIQFAGDEASVPYCRKYCESRGFKYTGVQESDLCLCGNSYGRHGKVNDENSCFYSCRGNPIATCGGPWKNEIYHTFDVEPKRIGCYKESNEVTHEPYKNLKEMTVPYCLTYCKSKGFNYMGVRFSTIAFICTCGNLFSRHGRVRDNECSRKCPGDKNQNTFCGGDKRLEIYITGQDIGRRIGCYKNGSIREFAMTTNLGDNASVPSCRNLCRSRDFNYTGLQGTFCLCGNSYGGYGNVSDIECSLPCPGNKLITCGGDRNLMTDGHGRYEIYHTFDVK